MTDIEIRLANPDDCQALSIAMAAVIQDIPYYNDLAKKSEISKFSPGNLQSKISEDPFSVILATAHTNIIGFCLTRFDDYLVWLEWFGVTDSFRGNNIARLLLKELENTIVSRSCHKIWCDCRTTNEASIHILTTSGYKQLVTIPSHWYGQDFILWEKLV